MSNINYKHYFNLIAKVINSADPIGLIAGGAPPDEYNSEINKILIVVQNENNKKNISEKIYHIFCDSFDKKLAGEISDYEKIAEKIVDLKSSGKLF